MNFLKYLIILAFFSQGEWGIAAIPVALDGDFSLLSKKLVSGNLQNTFCYAKSVDSDPEQLNVEGVGADSTIRLASISKIVTSFWAISTLGPHYQFETHFSWSPKTKHLHISGGFDPFMGEQSLMYIVSEIDGLGIHDIDLVTFDSKMIVFEYADIKSSYDSVMGSQENPKPEQAHTTLTKYLNTHSWSQSLIKIYGLLRTKARLSHLDMIASPKIAARIVSLSEVDDVKDEADAVHFTYRSAELHEYLKHMNANSINYPANILFRSLGGPDAFEKFIEQKLSFKQGDVQMYTGSGLEFYTDGDSKKDRVDNESTCENILKVMIALDRQLKTSGLSLPDVLLVSGVDQGTWAGDPSVSGAVAVKTGTLVQIPVINLAGVASTANGNYYFGMFFQMKSQKEIPQAHSSEKSLVDNIVQAGGGKSHIPLATIPQSFLSFRSLNPD